MNISIAERLRPFSHLPGTTTILPGSAFQVQIFPCLIRIKSLSNTLQQEIELYLDLKGPLEQFTIFNDLEKGRIIVYGKSMDGWVRYHLISALNHQGIRLFFELVPEKGINIEFNGNLRLVQRFDSIDLLETSPLFQPYRILSNERLSLGCTKAQDWDLIKRRCNLGEIFPFIYRLGRLIPLPPPPQSHMGTLSLLDDCRKSWKSQSPEIGEMLWKRLFKGAFHEMIVPQIEDGYFQGLVALKQTLSETLKIEPLSILSQSSHLIQELFVHQEGSCLSILPFLFPSFHCGRLTDVPIGAGSKLSLEWSKKTIQRMVLFAGKDEELMIKFRSSCRVYRLRMSVKDKGEVRNTSSHIMLKKNCQYLFDNFQ